MLTLPRLVAQSHSPEGKVGTSIYLHKATVDLGLITCTVFHVRSRRFLDTCKASASASWISMIPLDDAFKRNIFYT